MAMGVLSSDRNKAQNTLDVSQLPNTSLMLSPLTTAAQSNLSFRQLFLDRKALRERVISSEGYGERGDKMEQNGLEAGILTPEEYESRIAEYVKHIPKALELGVFLARDGTIFPVFIVPEEIINWLSERAKWKHKTELVGLHAFIEVVLDQERRICLPFCLVNKKARTFAGLAVMTTFDPETRRYGGRPGKLVLASEEWGDAGKAILVEVELMPLVTGYIVSQHAPKSFIIDNRSDYCPFCTGKVSAEIVSIHTPKGVGLEDIIRKWRAHRRWSQ